MLQKSINIRIADMIFTLKQNHKKTPTEAAIHQNPEHITPISTNVSNNSDGISDIELLIIALSKQREHAV